MQGCAQTGREYTSSKQNGANLSAFCFFSGLHQAWGILDFKGRVRNIEKHVSTRPCHQNKKCAVCGRNRCHRFGLTCRQGLAPCNALPQAPNSPIYGFITQRSHNTLQQQVIHSHSEAVSPKISLSHGNRTPHRAFALASPSAAGSATDRPSPSAQRLRQQNNNSIMHPESNPTSALEASRFSPHNLTVNSIQRPSASEHGHSHRSPFNQRSPRNHGSHSVDANFSSSNVPAFDAAPATPERLSAVMQRACAAVATSGLLSKELSQLDSPHNSDAIRSTPVTTPIQSNGGPNQSLATPQRPRPLDAVVSDSILFHSSPNVESQAASIVAHCHTESSDGIRDVPAATNWDMSSEFLKNTPINAATAPVILIRRGSSNSSSDSTRSSRLQFVDDPATAEHKLDADFFVERQIETLQRQKLRSGISALRPTSAGAGARRSVRPDLVSGLGFKSIDSACLKTSDAIRVRAAGLMFQPQSHLLQLPPRPSTPVLGRYASAEEDIPYVHLREIQHLQVFCTFPFFLVTFTSKVAIRLPAAVARSGVELRASHAIR